jgi:hypothetical protein
MSTIDPNAESMARLWMNYTTVKEERDNWKESAQKAEQEIARLQDQLATAREGQQRILKAWDDWYDGPETMISGDMIEAILALKADAIPTSDRETVCCSCNEPCVGVVWLRTRDKRGPICSLCKAQWVQMGQESHSSFEIVRSVRTTGSTTILHSDRERLLEEARALIQERFEQSGTFAARENCRAWLTSYAKLGASNQ